MSILDKLTGSGAKGILDEYVKTLPTHQNGFDVFKGEWSSNVPGFESGKADLFDDSRIKWADKELGGLKGFKILELGPLEAGHSYMMQKMGAESIVGVESNSRAYLKCLIVKEALGLDKCKFLLGDFTPYLKEEQRKFDMILASGVLYHMIEPAELLHLMSKATDRIILWTHYYDEQIAKKHGLQERVYNGYTYKVCRRDYGKGLKWKGFCGGNNPYANWMSREDIFGYLKSLGFNTIKIGEDDVDHPHGPAITLAALKNV